MLLCTFSFVGKKAVHFLCCPVVCTDNEAMVVHVQDEVLALKVEREKERKREREEERKRGSGSGTYVEVELRK